MWDLDLFKLVTQGQVVTQELGTGVGSITSKVLVLVCFGAVSNSLRLLADCSFGQNESHMAHSLCTDTPSF